MARHTHATFEGVSILDVDPNALTRSRWFDKAAGDTALVVDLLKGDTGLLDHSGPGNGCVLGVPVVNQMLHDYGIVGDGDTAAAESVSIWQMYAPQPEGETEIEIFLHWAFYQPGPEPLIFEVLDGSWTVVDSAPLGDGVATFSGAGSWQTAKITGLTGGTRYTYRVVCADVSVWPLAPGNVLKGVTLGNLRIAADDTPLMSRQPSDPTDSTELATQTVSSAEVIDAHDFDTAEVALDGRAVSGYHTTQLGQTQSALIEMLSGAPVGTNETRVIAPSSSQSAYHDHSRLGSEFPSAPLLARFPLGGWCLGSSPSDGGTGKDTNGGNAAGSRNCPGWAIAQSVNLRELFDAAFWAPQDSTGRLSVYVLAYSPDGLLGSLTTSVSVSVYDDTNTLHSGPSASSTWTQMGTSKWYYLTVSGMSHAPAQLNRLTIGMTIVAGGAKTNGGSVRIASVFAALET